MPREIYDAAKRFFRKLLKKQNFVPRVIVTNKLKRYEAAKHRQREGLNDQAENFHHELEGKAIAQPYTM